MEISANTIITKLNNRLSEQVLQNIILETRVEGLEEQIRAYQQFAEQGEQEEE